MHLLKPLLATWACLVQVSLAGVSFTKWPTTVYTGRPATLRWKGDPSAPATITLRKGPSDNLKTLKVLTTQAGSGSFTWIPEESLSDGSDYALQIEQHGGVNYSGKVTVAHQPGKASPASTSKNTPLPSSSTRPLDSARKGVPKGNNGYVPSLSGSTARLNGTSSKSVKSSTTNDGATFRYISPEMTLAALAAIVYFAA